MCMWESAATQVWSRFFNKTLTIKNAVGKIFDSSADVFFYYLVCSINLSNKLELESA